VLQAPGGGPDLTDAREELPPGAFPKVTGGPGGEISMTLEDRFEASAFRKARPGAAHTDYENDYSFVWPYAPTRPPS
jgi:hypothetical protein